ncbi:type I methionyl aminopeptidase [Oceanicaulis alexandrii]|uniref:type I methionyl aminopeptidase n=1 Tax=Oceanicaulis alexandrii TaxID=153233 RepID=UPI0035CF0BAC
MTDTGLDLDVAPTRDGHIKRHTPEDFEGMRKAGQLSARALDMLVEYVKPGVSTQALDDMVREFYFDHGAAPATIFYRGYTKSSCTSINHVVCHGIPNSKPLRDGDIVNIDVTCMLDGWHGDTSRMFGVGEVKRKAARLVEVTYEAMMRGIEQVKPGNHFGDIGAAIQEYAEAQRYSVVRDFCGHGLGRLFHDSPNVLHFGEYGTGPVIEEGMFFTIEPMLNIGKPGVKVLNDGWTAVTRDKSLSAQFEHSIGVTQDGAELFTKSPAGLDQPPCG